jgi:peptidoglycan hydrolase-like protein with peptidoglycan-binding domain
MSNYTGWLSNRAGQSLPNLWRKKQGGIFGSGKYFSVPQFQKQVSISAWIAECPLNKGI